jgi:hypothetical protein
VIKYNSNQIKAIADRAEARSRGAIDDDDAECERGFDEACEKEVHEPRRKVLEAEAERLALLTQFDYEYVCDQAAENLNITVGRLNRLVKAKRQKKAAKKSAAPPNPEELRRVADHIIKHPDILSLFAEEFTNQERAGQGRAG